MDDQAGQVMDPHDNVRARDLSEVNIGKQASRPPHEFGTVSPPPPSAEQSPRNEDEVVNLRWKLNLRRRQQTGVSLFKTKLVIAKLGTLSITGASKQREKVINHARSLPNITECPLDWIQRWNEQIEQGTFPGPI